MRFSRLVFTGFILSILFLVLLGLQPNVPVRAAPLLLVAAADLSITKTDGVTIATPGGSVTYTITASNAGPSDAPGATVADTFPASLTVNWTCVGAGGGTCTAAGSGNINDTVNLPVGGSVTYTASATISSFATGTLSNTATVAAPGGVADPDPANNSATDTDTLVAFANLSITKTDGVTTATPGGSVTYTITASNAGPSNAAGATVADTFPASLTVNWTCVGAGGGVCTGAGSGNISDTVNLPAGGSVTYTASATISAFATGTLSNTATVATPGGVTDPVPGNNSATDSDTLTPQADLSITKTDGVTTVTPGGSTTYTITASNAGPSNANGSTVADTFPASLTVTWTCIGAGGGTCTAAGSGNINDTVNLPAGGSVTYTASATISSSAMGTLANTATVAAPGGVTDPDPANNSATDSDTLSGSADLSITKTDGVTTATAGGSVTYTITASNAGPSSATGATVADTFPASLTATWTCIGAGGGTCTAAGSGNINDTVNLPMGASVTYTVSATIHPSATGTLSNTATVSSGVTDPDPANNSATDSDTLNVSADVSITKTDGVTTTAPGGSVTYTIVASNAGPSNATGATVADTFPAALTAITWTCVGAGGGICTASGSGNIVDTVNLPAGGSVTYTVSATVSPSATGTLSNTATVSPPAKVADPNPANNSATDTDTIALFVTVTINQAAGQSDPDFADSASKKINFTATFSQPVTGFTGSDISFAGTTLSGTLSAAVTQIAPMDGTTYNVAVKGMIPKGTVFVSIPANKVTSISTSAPNQSSTSTDNNIIVDYVLVEFSSTAAKDGWVLESTETSGVGGSLDSTAITSRVGDDANDRQYRSVLDFSTSSIPDSAVIFAVNLRIIEHSITGTNPFTTHGLLKLDIKSGFFSTASTLQTPDFESAPDKSACNFETVPEILEAIGTAYRCIVFDSAFSSINLTGSTQFRLRFATDDNDDMAADTFNFYSGDYGGATQRPRLFIKYYVPPAP